MVEDAKYIWPLIAKVNKYRRAAVCYANLNHLTLLKKRKCRAPEYTSGVAGSEHAGCAAAPIWIGRKKTAGRREGWSHLVFDQILDLPPKND